jgi:hypothetical protein
MPKVSYVAYIDESGDDGVGTVRPVDPNGATEWFTLSAVVVRAEAQSEAVWVRGILRDIELDRRHELHFQPLDDWRKAIVCNRIAGLPLRCFVAMSHKVNMRGHQNPQAAKVSAGKTWFYWWMTWLLLERATDYCERRSLRDYGSPRLVRLEFSRRGGLRYPHFQSYLYWLRMQSRVGALFLKRGDLKWSVIDPINEVAAYDHPERAGLQIADAVASAFYLAVACDSPDPQFACALKPRMTFALVLRSLPSPARSSSNVPRASRVQPCAAFAQLRTRNRKNNQIDRYSTGIRQH